MVRFIMACFFPLLLLVSLIYIPIWLDLLYGMKMADDYATQDLHSNMVRFIIIKASLEGTVYYDIYIPIWLDLLSYARRIWYGDPNIYIPIWLDLLY